MSGHTDPSRGYHYDDDNDIDLKGDSEIREQDRYLPVANIARIMKKVLPNNAKITKEAKEAIQECVSEFISFITSEASDKCLQEKRKTINGDDLIWSLSTLGFDRYVEPLRVYLGRYRESVKGEKPERRTTVRKDLPPAAPKTGIAGAVTTHTTPAGGTHVPMNLSAYSRTSLGPPPDYAQYFAKIGGTSLPSSSASQAHGSAASSMYSPLPVTGLSAAGVAAAAASSAAAGSGTTTVSTGGGGPSYVASASIYQTTSSNPYTTPVTSAPVVLSSVTSSSSSSSLPASSVAAVPIAATATSQAKFEG